MMHDLIYIATPYTGTPEQQVERFVTVNKFCAFLMDKDILVFSPISECHPISVQCGLPGNFSFWKKLDEAMISRCQKLYVLCQAGWQDSFGVNCEIDIAKSLNIPIEYYHHETFERVVL